MGLVIRPAKSHSSGNSTGLFSNTERNGLDSRLLCVSVSANRRHSFEGIADRQNRHGVVVLVVVVSVSSISWGYERAQECLPDAADWMKCLPKHGQLAQDQQRSGLESNQASLRGGLPWDQQRYGE